ncbi:MAG: ABC transporter substrate-binding protein [Spirochaetaceae bacterium]|nr:ABC transporter substrate-binding protein [Spirochaetaceae bacterium]
MDKKFKTIAFVIIFIFLCISCKQGNTIKAVNENIYAKNFSYSDHKNYIEVCANAGGSEYIWYLYRDEKPSVEGDKGTIGDRNRIVQYVKIPVQRIISLSAENIFFLESLNSLDKLKAIDLARNSSNKKVKELVREGSIAQTGEGRDIDIEMVYSINPDLIITPWTGGDYDSTGLLLKHGFPVAVTAGWLESHPLGRTEWLIFLSLFLDVEDDGKNILNDTVSRYNSLKEKVPLNQKKPVVFLNMIHGDSWNIPSGGSYFAIMLEHAGAAYPWADIKRDGSLFYDFEEIYTVANNADIWLLNTQGIKTLKDILNRDKRYSLFKAFQSKRIYNNDLMDKGTGNPYWDEGTAYPDRILSDLINIVHYSSFLSNPKSDNEKYYFRHLE